MDDQTADIMEPSQTTRDETTSLLDELSSAIQFTSQSADTRAPTGSSPSQRIQPTSHNTRLSSQIQNEPSQPRQTSSDTPASISQNLEIAASNGISIPSEGQRFSPFSRHETIRTKIMYEMLLFGVKLALFVLLWISYGLLRYFRLEYICDYQSSVKVVLVLSPMLSHGCVREMLMMVHRGIFLAVHNPRARFISEFSLFAINVGLSMIFALLVWEQDPVKFCSA